MTLERCNHREAAQYVGSNDSVMVCERVEAVETELNRTPRRAAEGQIHG